MDKKSKSSLIKIGFQQAFSVALYCSMIGLFFFNANKIFGNRPDNFTAPIILLLLFSASALTCGLLVFYRPYKMFFDGNKKQAIDIVLYTTYFLFGFFLLILSIGLLR